VYAAGTRGHLAKWRTGIEGRISTRSDGWDRTRVDGTDRARIWAGHGVLAHNLVKTPRPGHLTGTRGGACHTAPRATPASTGVGAFQVEGAYADTATPLQAAPCLADAATRHNQHRGITAAMPTSA
jgi:hypothetical protein